MHSFEGENKVRKFYHTQLQYQYYEIVFVVNMLHLGASKKHILGMYVYVMEAYYKYPYFFRFSLKFQVFYLDNCVSFI